MSKANSGSNTFKYIGAAALGLYLLYWLIVFVLWVAKVFVYWGYNFIFFTDNLLAVTPFNPIIIWGIYGLFVGAVIGVTLAVKKYKLSPVLILYPVSFVALLILIMGLVNTPTQYKGIYTPAASVDYTRYTVPIATPERKIYKLTSAVNVRTGPSIKYAKLLTLKKGTEVELIERISPDHTNTTWLKIKYKGQEGYLNAKFVAYSHSEE